MKNLYSLDLYHVECWRDCSCAYCEDGCERYWWPENIFLNKEDIEKYIDTFKPHLKSSETKTRIKKISYDNFLQKRCYQKFSMPIIEIPKKPFYIDAKILLSNNSIEIKNIKSYFYNCLDSFSDDCKRYFIVSDEMNHNSIPINIKFYSEKNDDSYNSKYLKYILHKIYKEIEPEEACYCEKKLLFSNYYFKENFKIKQERIEELYSFLKWKWWIEKGE